MADIEKLIVLGEKVQLTGKDLLSYIQELKDQERKSKEEDWEREEKRKQADFDREERRAAREQQKLELELQLKIEENKRKDQPLTLRTTSKVPKLPSFVDNKDDLDSYLGRFERYAVAQKWMKDEWAVNLSALLTGKALETYYRLPETEASKYDSLKAALLKRYQLTENGFREKFFTSKADPGEAASQYMARIENYLNRWIDLSETERTFEGLKHLFLREQFVNSTHRDLSMFLREKKLRKLEEVIQEAANYQEAHGGNLSSKFSPAGNQHQHKTDSSQEKKRTGVDDRTCYHCKTVGHIASKCPYREETSTNRSQVCFLCNRRGHIAKDCWNTGRTQDKNHDKTRRAACLQNVEDEDQKKACQGCSCCMKRKSCTCDGESEQAASFQEIAEVDSKFREKEIELEDGHAHKVCHLVCKRPLPVCSCNKLPTSRGYLNGFQATTMRDSGCSGIVVRAEYVHSKQYTGKNRLCLMIDGTARNVPLARVRIDCPYFKGETEAMVMPLPVYDLIIGNVPGAREPNDPDRTWTYDPHQEVGLAVVTRLQRQEQHRKTPKPLKVPEACNIQSSKLESLTKEQEEDLSLQSIYLKAKNKDPPKTTKESMTWFEVKRGVLYRMFKKINHPRDPVIKQIVVPTEKRPLILKMAHESVMAGHMGIQRTLDRIQTNFYWPGINSDVIRFCRS